MSDSTTPAPGGQQALDAGQHVWLALSPEQALFLLIATLIIYNGAVIWFLRRMFTGIDFSSALAEKDPRLLQRRAANAADLASQATDAAANAGGARDADTKKQLQDVADQSTKAADEQISDDTSFSRTAGAAGAAILSCLFWAFGNVVIVKMSTGPASDLAAMLGPVGTFITAGATLFAPYAANQIMRVFTPPAKKEGS